MKNYIFLIFFILISFNIVLCETVELPYTDSSNITKINDNYDNISYSVYTLNNNEIYQIKNYYKFGSFNVKEGVHISNISYNYNYGNITISEKYNITAGFPFISKKVTWDLMIYENDILTSNDHIEYYVFITSSYFSKTKYTFLTNEIIIKNDYSDSKGYNWNYYYLTLFQPLLLNNVNLTHETNQVNTGRSIYIEYIYQGKKPKSYYIEMLHPVLRLPYKLISSWDNDNDIINILLILSYILKSLFFWIKVLYTSMFTLLIIFLIAVIPFISLMQSNNQVSFINRMFANYALFFNLIINIVKYTINLIIKLIELIPFI